LSDQLNGRPHFAIQNLSLSRQGKLVLQEISCHVASGEIVGLLGPSGSGKSSLLRCLNRLTPPPPQTIFLEGQDITGLDVLRLRRQVGMVFQRVALFPGTVADNIAYGPGLRGETVSSAEIERLLALADLPPELAGRDSQELSGGQAQRVALARSLATSPSAMLLDEPTSALDPAATRNVEATLLKLRQSLGLTILWVTHDPEQARRVADRVYLLVDGRIADEGEPEELLRADSQHLTALFAAGELGGRQT